MHALITPLVLLQSSLRRSGQRHYRNPRQQRKCLTQPGCLQKPLTPLRVLWLPLPRSSVRALLCNCQLMRCSAQSSPWTVLHGAHTSRSRSCHGASPSAAVLGQLIFICACAQIANRLQPGQRLRAKGGGLRTPPSGGATCPRLSRPSGRTRSIAPKSWRRCATRRTRTGVSPRSGCAVLDIVQDDGRHPASRSMETPHSAGQGINVWSSLHTVWCSYEVMLIMTKTPNC